MATKASGNTLHQRFWRWHFFAGLIVCPFAIALAITGAIYLFKPQIEYFTEARINASAPAIAANSSPLPADTLIETLLSQHPGAKLKRYTLAKENDSSVEIELISAQGVATMYWLDKHTGTTLHHIVSKQQFLSVIKKIHSELLLGNVGSYVVELMASWLMILIITGLYLWFNSPISNSTARLLTPQLDKHQTRKQWLSLHGVFGLWAALPIMLLLLSGLPWTQLWGTGFDKVQAVFTQPVGQEWFVTLQSSPNEHAEHAHHVESLWDIRADQDEQTAVASLPQGISLHTITQTVVQLNLVPPVHIQPPKPNNGVWTARSMPQNRADRVTVHYDQYSGKEILRINFEDHSAIKRLASHGISLHEGALFGWLNQLLGVVTALAIIAISSFGLTLWWRRRPKNGLGAPAKPTRPLSKGLISLVVITGILLPAAGISMAVIAALEWLWAKRSQSKLKHN